MRREAKASPAGPTLGRRRIAPLFAGATLVLSLLGSSSAWADGNVNVTVTGPGAVTSTAASGFGLGTIIATPGQINCNSAGTPVCSANFDDTGFLELAEVTLTATADAGKEFYGWSQSGATSAERCTTPPQGTPTCKVNLSGTPGPTSTVTAEFGPPRNDLAIATAGTGTGTVECEVNGVPPAPCATTYVEGTEVALVPVSDPGSEFLGFNAGSGSAAACGTTCEFTIEADSSVTANFGLIPRALTIPHAGTGAGTVRCEVDGSYEKPCAANYPNGTDLALVATPSNGSTFGSFDAGSGSAAACAGTTCEFTIEADSSVTASFDAVPRSLIISKASTGSGSVRCAVGGGPAGPCAGAYLNGTRVTLEAIPRSGSQFAGWAGVPCPGTDSCAFTIRDDTAVRAYFDALPATSSGTAEGKTGGKAGGAAVAPCLKRANHSYRRTLERAKHKRGKARARAIRAAKQSKRQAIRRCRGGHGR